MIKQFTAEQAEAYGALVNHSGESSGRWPASRKQALLAAIETGALTLEEASARYALTAIEIEEWRRGVWGRRDVQPYRVRRLDQGY